MKAKLRRNERERKKTGGGEIEEEPLDEIEEWRMLMQHYCFLVGSQQGLKEALWLTPGDEGAAAFPQGTPGMLLPGVPRPRGLPCAD